MGYQFNIQYRPEWENKAAYAISRINHSASLFAITIPKVIQLEQLAKEVEADVDLQKLIQEIQRDPSAKPNYQWANNQLLFKGILCLPKGSTLIPILLQEGHNGSLGGHLGFLKTYKRIAANVYWVGMKRDIHRYVNQCAICQQHKYQALSPGGLLQPLPILGQVWEDIAMNFIEGLPRSGNMDTILVVVDRLSKYGHFIGLKHPFTASSVTAIFVKKVIRLHGVPRSIVSDRDKVFMSHFWEE